MQRRPARGSFWNDGGAGSMRKTFRENDMSEDVRFNIMHFMPYIHLPPNHKEYKSLWVNFPNKFYDPKKAFVLYEQYLSELELADRLGFDAIVVNEHHNTSYSMMPAPNLIAANLVSRIKNARICVWGTPPNLEFPNRLAEEYAMLDVLSKGRLEVAFPLGTGMEYWSNPVNPVTARERHRESIDIIIKAWTSDGPTSYYGDFYTYRFLNIWPRPYQQPHPPCYIVGTGSPETIELAAERGFGYSAVFVTRQRALELNNKLRERAAHFGNKIRPDQLPLGVLAYVAETEEQARAEFTEHLQFFFEDALRTTPQFLAPPGYISIEQLKARAAVGDKLHGSFDFKLLEESLFIAVGTAEKVANQIGEWGRLMGTNHFNIQGCLGNMPHWKVVKNLSMIAEGVIPRLRHKPAAQPMAAE
jgi:alkanesulfonate monooxygenase SsuD/methylene tetrahydromethanopterin reductase-like flavin-dependent oxidoreductase (luciferase family)